MTDPTRPIPTNPTPRGTRGGSSRASPTQTRTRAQVGTNPHRVIPVIFVPGIMGSNLRTVRAVRSAAYDVDFAAGDAVWRIDSTIGFARRWAGKSAAYRQLLIHHGNLEADPRGSVGISPGGRLNSVHAERVRKGWGTVSWVFYGQMLEWLSSSLNQIGLRGGAPNPQLEQLLRLANTTPAGATTRPPTLTAAMIQKLMSFDFPVYACGYNWAASNLISGNKLATKIDEVIAYHNARNGRVCDKVILITHSMGGLVARAAAKASGAEGKILGIIHGVMPTHGAAAMYKRAALGFGNEAEGFWGFIPGEIASSALGYSAAETTPVLAYNAGPLELAPNRRYNGGRPWLFIKNAQGATLKALPTTDDPYAEIYARTDVWWRAVHPQYLNPANLRINGLVEYSRTLASAKSYHDRLADAGGFHSNTYTHYSVDANHPSWGTLTWRATASLLYSPPPIAMSPYGYNGPQRIDRPRAVIAGPPESWRITSHTGARGFILVDANGSEVSITVEPKGAPGDGTVPALASAAGVDAHSQLVVRHAEGYEHDRDYNDIRVRASVIDAIARMIQPLPAQ